MVKRYKQRLTCFSLTKWIIYSLPNFLLRKKIPKKFKKKYPNMKFLLYFFPLRYGLLSFLFRFDE